MAIKKIKKKGIVSSLVKNAVKFIGSTVGITKYDEVVEGSLPLALYPAHYADNTIINCKIDRDISIANCEGDIPMWMRVEHAPNISKRKIKRKICRNIKKKNRLLNLVKKNQAKVELYKIKLNQDMNNPDELYDLRKKYVETIKDNKDINEQLSNNDIQTIKSFDSTNEITKTNRRKN